MTSIERPFASRAFLASRAKWTGVPYATIVRSVPSRRTRALPNGTANSAGTFALAIGLL